jgi:hypothetical protein
MRLLRFNDHSEHSLVERHGDDIPDYGILSHTWGADDEEVTYQDLINGTGKKKSGYKKITFCADRARSEGLEYFWIDTCCINQANFTELSTAINSMFRWYQEATGCYVYLSDVPDPEDTSSNIESAFLKSRWFKRGWTLQELIAPLSVQFFSRTGEHIGSKESRIQQIHEITRIPIAALERKTLSEFPAAERLSWTKGRTTKIEEDEVYCLLGIFGIHMALIYGEGKQNASDRLQRKVRKSLPPASSVPNLLLEHASKHVSDQQQSSSTTSYPSILAVDELQGHENAVNGVAFLPDSKRLVSASWDKTIKLWDTQTRKALQTLRGHEAQVCCIAVSRDGNRIASGSTDTSIRLWDAHSGAAISTLEGHGADVWGVAFSPDGRLLASASKDMTVRLWNVLSGTPVHILRGHEGWACAIAYSPNGSVIASGANGDGAVRVWDVLSGAPRLTLKGHADSVFMVTFRPDGNVLASGGGNFDKTIKLWDTFSGALLMTLNGHNGSIFALAFSPDGNLLASAGGHVDFSVRLWNARSGTAIGKLGVHDNWVHSLAWSPDYKLLASGCNDQTMRLWSFSTT